MYFCIHAQEPVDCAKIRQSLETWKSKVLALNPRDPELIPLHYLLVLDYQREMQQFDQKYLPVLSRCSTLNYHETIAEFDWIHYLCRLKMDSLTRVSARVDSLFYETALREVRFDNKNNALYFLDRALQYNPVYPDALLEKWTLLLENKEYDECMDILQILYHECVLSRQHEERVSACTIRFYDVLYREADSLTKVDLFSDALTLFQKLEVFCQNMPSGYCNDDYYHGILRSKSGVYESYVRVARASRERGNMEMERRFLDYAEKYMEENARDFTSPAGKYSRVELPDLENKTGTQDTINTFLSLPVPDTPTKKGKSPEDMNKEYLSLLTEAISHCIRENISAAYDALKKAKEMENCNCFPPDPRVQQLYESIQEIIKK
ncbi:MAG: hypothetical protein LBR51_00790 [Bacteroidales bacterium]|jgi:tetratricopeptide (TPR) repeat protein|nr:hypothetical protein [Bacteroidales bacterium]